MMQEVLKNDWAKLESTKARSDKYYPYANDKSQREIVECMYLGQLVSLILSQRAWPLFQHLFRDKRHLQDMLSAISPVRNDRAHFEAVPAKDLLRCKEIERASGRERVCKTG